MGQQQLLLIVLGVIVVGIAVVVGINLFNASSIEANRDGVVSDLNNLGAMAVQFYKKPVSMGGGGRSFTTTNGAAAAWDVPTIFNNQQQMVTYAVTPVRQIVTIIGIGTEIGEWR